VGNPSDDDFTGEGRSGPSANAGPARCFIATAAYGSELAPPVQFLREFREDIVLRSRFKKGFESILEIYYKFSPAIAKQMKKHKALKYTMKYLIVWPFVASTIVCAFLIKQISKKN